jgi:hypothetical protein
MINQGVNNYCGEKFKFVHQKIIRNIAPFQDIHFCSQKFEIPPMYMKINSDYTQMKPKHS